MKNEKADRHQQILDVIFRTVRSFCSHFEPSLIRELSSGTTTVDETHMIDEAA
jgi:hypothetical protein